MLRATVVCGQAVDRLREFGDRDGEAATWDSLGVAYHRLGEYPAAIRSLDRAATMHREDGDRYSEALVLTHLGDVRSEAGDPSGARETWLTALAIFEDLGHPDAEAVALKIKEVGPA